MADPWSAGPGVLQLPSGRVVRGRALRRPLPEGPEPEFGVYLVGRDPVVVPWQSRTVRWPDFRGPVDTDDAVAALREVLRRCEHERVEVACGGGRGRTGTALAGLLVLEGVGLREAVRTVRRDYDRWAVEVPAQWWFLRRLAGTASEP